MVCEMQSFHVLNWLWMHMGMQGLYQNRWQGKVVNTQSDSL
jgi:hypothetical protein